MKRSGQLMAPIAEMENLRVAFWKASKGKGSRQEVVDWRGDLEANLLSMRRALLAGTVRVGEYHFFTIYDPKERLICAASFGERVLHHALMNICEPIFERRLIHNTYACRKGKGRIAGLERAQHYARKHRWYLKLDIRKYFDSINHDMMLGILERIIKDRALLSLFKRIIGSYQTSPSTGLPIGNLTSQHFANLYLGKLDQYVKHHLRVSAYVRYMDDFVLWADEKKELLEWNARMGEFLENTLRLECKPEQINRADRGMPFLGSRLFPDHLRLDRRGCRRFKERVKALEKSNLHGEIGEAELQERVTSLVSYTRTCEADGFRRAFFRKRGERKISDGVQGRCRVGFEPRDSRWQLEQQRQQLSGRESQQQQPVQQQQQHRVPPCVHSSERIFRSGEPDSDPAPSCPSIV